MKTSRFALPILCALGCGGSASQGTGDLASSLEVIRATTGVPALAALVADGDGVLDGAAVGVRRLGASVSVTADDKWHLGSCTKAMTATLAAMLVEDGALDWDATLPELLPEAASTMDPAFAGVTLAQLLAHRSGLADDSTSDLWADLWRSTDPPADQRARFARTLLSRAPQSAPGTSFTYSNFGYIVAGAILEHASGESWEGLIAGRLFAPLGMTSCGFGAPASPGQADEPWGHRGSQPVPPGPGADNPPALGPAGTVHCSLADWSKFVRLFLGGGTRLVSPGSLARLTTPWPGQSYALGWLLVDRPALGGRVLTHDGSNTMFYVLALVAPEKDRVLLAATNRADAAAQAALERTVTALTANVAP